MDDIQKQVKSLEELITKRTGKSKENVYFLLTNLSSEVGELADEIVGLEGERIENTTYTDKSKAAKEIVDVIVNAIRIANNYGIDIDQNFSKRLEELRTKFS